MRRRLCDPTLCANNARKGWGTRICADRSEKQVLRLRLAQAPNFAQDDELSKGRCKPMSQKRDMGHPAPGYALFIGAAVLVRYYF